MRRVILIAALALGLLCPSAESQITKSLAPLAVQHFDTANGTPCAGCKLFTYQAGTTTKLSTYTTATGVTQNTNPIILNSRGEAPVWMPPTAGYKFVLAPSTDTDPPTNPIWTADQIFSQPFQCGGTPVTGNVVSWGTGPCLADSGVAAAAQRSQLSGALTLYVNPALGADSATCGTAVGASACRTIPQAVANAFNNYDTKGFSITIQLADSLLGYTTGTTVSGRLTGGGLLIIKGNTASPTSVIIDGAGAANCFLGQFYAFVRIQDLTVQNCAVLIGASGGHTTVYVGNVVFSGCATSAGVQMYASRFGAIEIVSTYTISDSGGCAWHIQAADQGYFVAAQTNTGATVGEIGDDLSYSAGFVGARSLSNVLFSGYSASPYDLNGHAATGNRWFIDGGGTIQTLVTSASFFPGSVVGALHGVGSYNAPLHVGTTMTGGGASPTFTGDDFNGSVVEDAGSTGVVLTFGGGATGAFDRTPVCTVSYLAAVTTPTYTVTQTTLTTSHAAGATAFMYECHGG